MPPPAIVARFPVTLLPAANRTVPLKLKMPPPTLPPAGLLFCFTALPLT